MPAGSPCNKSDNAKKFKSMISAPEVMFECANVAMLKLTGILKLKGKA